MVDLGSVRTRALVGLVFAGALLIGGCTTGGTQLRSTAEASAPSSSTALTSASSPATSPVSTSSTTTGSVPVVTVEVGKVVCPDKLHSWSPRFESDLDGDGQTETIAVDRPDVGETTIVVCGTGLTVEPFRVGDVNKPAEVFAMDVDSDGVTELLVGGPTGGPIRFSGTVLRFDRDRWVDPGVDLQVTVVRRTGSSFGCVDIDGDGVRELVSETYELDADTYDEATRIDWQQDAVYDPNGEPGTTVDGTYDLVEDAPAARHLLDGTCGDQVIVEAPLR